jgi:hypothetical protein
MWEANLCIQIPKRWLEKVGLNPRSYGILEVLPFSLLYVNIRWEPSPRFMFFVRDSWIPCLLLFLTILHVNRMGLL